MSTTVQNKVAVVIPPKIQCISLKANREQCVRNAGDGTQFCWQHQKSENKCGTILNPAPLKVKSTRGRPLGSKTKRAPAVLDKVSVDLVNSIQSLSLDINSQEF